MSTGFGDGGVTSGMVANSRQMLPIEEICQSLTAVRVKWFFHIFLQVSQLNARVSPFSAVYQK